MERPERVRSTTQKYSIKISSADNFCPYSMSRFSSCSQFWFLFSFPFFFSYYYDYDWKGSCNLTQYFFLASFLNLIWHNPLRWKGLLPLPCETEREKEKKRETKLEEDMGMGGLGSKAYAMLLLNPSLIKAKQNMVFLPYTSHTAVFLYFSLFLVFLQLLIHLRSLNLSHLVILSLPLFSHQIFISYF